MKKVVATETATATETETETIFAKIYVKAKQLYDSLVQAKESDSHISMEEGFSTSFPSSQSSETLSFMDSVSLSATEVSDTVSDCLKNNNTPASDRFLGEAHIYSKRYQGENVRYFQPQSLSFFELVFLANVVHMEYPYYSRFGTQCFFYAGGVYGVAEKHSGVHPVKNANPTQNNLLYNIDSHVAYKHGRWKGVKVGGVDQGTVSDIHHKFKKLLAKQIAKVIF